MGQREEEEKIATPQRPSGKGLTCIIAPDLSSLNRLFSLHPPVPVMQIHQPTFFTIPSTPCSIHIRMCFGFQCWYISYSLKSLTKLPFLIKKTIYYIKAKNHKQSANVGIVLDRERQDSEQLSEKYLGKQVHTCLTYTLGYSVVYLRFISNFYQRFYYVK